MNPAATAIAAVLALAPLSAFAQVVAPASTPQDTTAASPPPVAPTVAAPPAASAPATPDTQPVFKPQSAVVQPTPPVQQPVADTAESTTAASEAVATPASQPAAVKKAEPARRTAANESAADTPVVSRDEARTVTPASVPVATANTDANTNNAPASPNGEFLPPQTAPAKAPAAAPAQDGAALTAAGDNGAEIAQWALGLGALALVAGGGAILMRRRTSERVERERRRSPRYRRQNLRPEVVEEPALVTEAAPVAAAAVVAAPAMQSRNEEIAAPMPQREAEPLGTSAFSHWSSDGDAADLDQHREAMIAERPSAENPFRTRKARLRRANFLLRQHGVGSPADAAQVTAARAAREQAPADKPAQQVTYKFSVGQQRQPMLRPKYS